MKKPARLPALVLVAEETGDVILSLPAGRWRAGQTSHSFDQPGGRVAARLAAAAAGEADGLAITHPPTRRRRVGAESVPLGRPAPAE